MTRMSTLATSGRINEEIVAEEIERLTRVWTLAGEDPDIAGIVPGPQPPLED